MAQGSCAGSSRRLPSAAPRPSCSTGTGTTARPPTLRPRPHVPAATTPPSARTSSPCSTRTATLPASVCIRVAKRAHTAQSQLLQQNKHCSKRDIYYMYPSIFVEVAVVDHAINDICILFKCSRHNLNVVPVVKGLVMGWIRFVEGEKKVYCITNVNAAFSVPVSIEAIKDVVSVAHYILVVEKETVPLQCSSVWPMTSSVKEIAALLLQEEATQIFQQEGMCSLLSTLVISEDAIPVINSFSHPRFLRYLVEQLHLPAYCLVDSDPYGFDILATYKFGSLQLAYDANLLRVPDIRWLGVFTSDLEDFCLPDCCLLHLSPEDRRKAEGILARCYLHKEAPEWRSELEAMLQKGVKFEIEALSASSISFLSDRYIPQKIKQGRHL
ncbi:meiotic recombination protein SPO11-1 isoform X3 [Panicum hallii]|uniref:meiotic recombination protein SPO11-1 isoform X3 n=1 Tax=Panicum hallii TaxID=206008 RepID=UPI000DF4D83A|nr:meiotic recombination protein SPO11-1 isoform X3 [Panicum hallii]